MTDASAILISLDRFIEQLARHDRVTNSHRVATQDGAMATPNPLTNQLSGHSCHSGHPEQETATKVDLEEPASPPPSGTDSVTGCARKVLSADGYSGQSGKSQQNQPFTGDHRDYGSGQSGKSPLYQLLVRSLIGSETHRAQLVSPVDDVRSDPAWWRDQYEERARHRELGGRRPRAEAEVLAWGDMQWLWHKQRSERVPPGICGGCRKPIRTAEAIPLIDGAYVHDGKGHECLIAYGSRWRRQATAELRAFGLEPPPGFEQGGRS